MLLSTILFAHEDTPTDSLACIDNPGGLLKYDCTSFNRFSSSPLLHYQAISVLPAEGTLVEPNYDPLALWEKPRNFCLAPNTLPRRQLNRFIQDVTFQLNAIDDRVGDNPFEYFLDDSIFELSSLQARIDEERISLKRLSRDVAPEIFQEQFAEVEQELLRLARYAKGLARRISISVYRIDYRASFRTKTNVIFKNLDDEDHIA